MKYSLIIDTGTSSMRGVLFNEAHQIEYVFQKNTLWYFRIGNPQNRMQKYIRKV